MWTSKTRRDLVIEVWEALDCESIGARELVAIEKELQERLGPHSVEMPMRLARTLADEGAVLRHAEILELDVARRTADPFEHFFRTLFTDTGLEATLDSIRRIDDLRRRLESEGDKDLLRRLRKIALEAKERCKALVERAGTAGRSGSEAEEAFKWLTLWLESPDIFENWLTLRRSSAEFMTKFPAGETEPETEQPF